MAIPNEQNNRKEQMTAFLGDAASEPVGAPRNRDEEWALYLKAKAAGESATLPVGAPRNREEEWLMWLGDNIGGGDVTVEPLSATQNGTYTAPSGKAYSPVTVNVSGGVGDNTAETITGTMANPFGEHTAAEIIAGIGDNSVTVRLTLSIGANTMTMAGNLLRGNLQFSVAIFSSLEEEALSTAGEALYASDGSLIRAWYHNRGTNTNLSGMASQIRTSLLLLTHPMP